MTKNTKWTTLKIEPFLSTKQFIIHATMSSICINNVIVSTNLQGVVRATPVKLLRGYDYSYVPDRTYGSQEQDENMIYNLLNQKVSFEEALATGVDANQLENLSEERFMHKFRELLTKCSCEEGHKYKFVNVIDKWVGSVYIKYELCDPAFKDPFIAIKVGLDGAIDHYDLIKECKAKNIQTFNDLIEELIKDDVSGNGCWVRFD